MEQLGDLLRASLTHASRPLVTLGEELTFLDDYLAIESARFEGRIGVSVQADDEALNAVCRASSSSRSSRTPSGTGSPAG